MSFPIWLRGAALNLLAKAALVVLGLAITIMVARRGPIVQGAFALFVACESVLVAIFSGLGLALAREVSHHRGQAAAPLSALLWLAMLAGLLACLVLGVVSWQAQREPYHHLWVLALGAPWLLLASTATGLWMGQGRMGPLNTVQVLAPSLVLFGLVGLSAIPESSLTSLGDWSGILGVLAIWVVAKSLVGISASVWALRATGCQKPEWGLVQRDLRFIGVIGLTNLVSLLNYRATLFILEHVRGLAEAGIYSVALQVGELLWMVSSAITISAYYRIGDPDRQVAARMTVQVVQINILAALAAAPILLLLAWWALPEILGPIYKQARWPLLALLPGVAGYAAASSLSAFYTNHLGRPQLSGLVAGISMLLNVLLSLWWVPHYGALGAALATSVAYLTAIIIGAALFLRATDGHWRIWLSSPWRSHEPSQTIASGL